MDIATLISSDKEVLGGKHVFAGTRVPVETLFDHLEAGVSLNEFLDDFPTVSREQAIAILDVANKVLSSDNLERLYAAVA
jgi:uncharacterized protein (DUF433 family)